jgi:hypothetical protein
MGSSSASVRGLAAAALAVAVTLLTGGCYWSKYDKLARTHVDLLLAMAAKMADVVRDEGTPPPALAEYRYPLERARDFARIAARRFEGRPSLTAFRDFCDAYETLLTAADQRGAEVSTEPAAAFDTALAALRARAASVRAALDAERG